jgi:hypothetical protein
VTGACPAAYVRQVIRTILIAATMALALGGCSDKTNGPAQGGSASLRVKHVLDRSARPVYMEGAVWHVRVVDSDGAAVLDRRLLDNSISLRLERGRYRLESEELPCDGNCDHLDPPADRCATDFEVEPGQDLAATVTLRPLHGCEIALLETAGT